MPEQRHPRPTSPRVRVKRGPKKGRYDRGSLNDVLDAGLVAHVAFSEDTETYCLPMLFARIDEHLLIHGARSSRLIRALAGGAPACVTVTLLHGLVLARSAFEHSANYSSATLLGRFSEVQSGEARLTALRAFTEKLIPGRWDEVRQPNTSEMKATMVLKLPLDEFSVKTRSGPPDDDDSPDAKRPTWAGVIPIAAVFGKPEPSPGLDPRIGLGECVERFVDTGLRPRSLTN